MCFTFCLKYCKIYCSHFYLLRKGDWHIQNDGYRSNFQKGAAALVILTLLQEGDLYGYQLSQMMKERSEGEYCVPEGSLYPALYKLIEQGFVTDERKLVGKRLTRVYYHLEDSGREHLKKLTADYFSAKAGIERILASSQTPDENEQ